MRKFAFAIAAAALLLAGAFAWRADAMTAAGTEGLPAAAKTYSPIEQATCKGKKGPFCQPGFHLRCTPWCHCVPC